MPAIQISPHFRSCVHECLVIAIDLDNEEYFIPWADLSRNPDMQSLDLSQSIKIHHTYSLDAIWKQSSFVAYGAFSHIRELKDCG